MLSFMDFGKAEKVLIFCKPRSLSVHNTSPLGNYSALGVCLIQISYDANFSATG